VETLTANIPFVFQEEILTISKTMTTEYFLFFVIVNQKQTSFDAFQPSRGASALLRINIVLLVQYE